MRSSALPFALSIITCLVLSFATFVYGSVIPVSKPNEASELSVEVAQNVTEGAHHLSKRFSNARFTFYDAGLGACGEYNTNSDFIVALNAPQWAGGAHCREKITISYRGKTTQATVMDLCPGCPHGGLDLTRGLFGYFANHDLGVIQGSWDFGSSGPPPPPPTTTRRTPAPTPAPPPPPPPAPTTTRTATRAAPTTTSPPPPPPTTTRAPPPPPPASTFTSTRSSSSSTAPSSAALGPPTASPEDNLSDNVVNQLNKVLTAFGILISTIFEEAQKQKQQPQQ